MKKEYKNLIRNTSIFALGTFGSKVLVFLIIPLYTHILTSSEYGIVDLITSSVSLLIPFSTLLIYEAAIRFLIGRDSDEKTTFNNSFFVFLIGCFFAMFLSPIILHFLNLSRYYIVFNALIILTSYTTIFGQYLRAVKDNWGFSLSGIIHSFFTVLLTLVLLLILKKGINGYLMALVISQALSGLFIFFRCKTLNNIDFKSINLTVLKKMLIYTLPLVPNNLMWWIMNAGDKYVINYYLGTSSNGIFSIAYKIPTILTMLFSIFMQAWQVSAIEEKGSQNVFYKNVFTTIMCLLIVCSSFIIFGIKPLSKFVLGADFNESWMYVPLLCIATLFNCFSTFAGVVYIVKKDSKNSFYTTFIGATVNICLNLILIRFFGLFGVVLGTIIGYLLVMILRFKDYKNYFNVSLIDSKFILSIIIIIIDAITYTFIEGPIKYCISFIIMVVILYISKDCFANFLNMIKENFFHKKIKHRL